RATAPQARQAARRAPDVAARGGSRVLGGRCLLLHGQGPRQLDFRARRAARPHVPARRRGAHGDDHGPAHGGGAGAQPAVLEGVNVLREVRFLTPEDIDAAMPIRAFAFGQAMSQEHREFLERNLKYIMGTFEDGRLASVGTMWPFTAYVGGTRKGLGGLAAVATAPTARRRGHVATLLRRWVEVLHERGVGPCADSPFDPRFYARYGFQSVAHGHLVKLPISVLDTDEPYGAVEVAPDEHAPLIPIHAAFAGRFSLSLTRDDGTRGGMDQATQPPGLD